MPAWEGTTRRARLPANWATIRRRILNRDGGQCTAPLSDGTRCQAAATDVHHIGPGDNHQPDNLTSLCAWHHRRHTAQEGNTARRRWSNRRPEPPHPGLIA